MSSTPHAASFAPNRPAGPHLTPEPGTSWFGGWRLPLRLAWRDIMRYKGRSALASLLILLPITTLAALLAFLSTAQVDEGERLRASLKGFAGVAEVVADSPGGAAMPAAGRPVTVKNPPTAAQVSKQAGTAVLETHEGDFVVSATMSSMPSGGMEYSETKILFADTTAPLFGRVAHLVSGRMPTKPGEVLVTEYGIKSGLPTSGTMSMRPSVNGPENSAKTTTVTVVGVAKSTSEYVAAIGSMPSGYKPDNPAQFLIANTRRLSTDDVKAWSRFGMMLTTPDTPIDTGSTGPDANTAFAIAVATMAVIAVTALLAGPAFAASAVRQRRSLGLIAANGGTRSVLHRVVLANALLLGVLTACVSAVVGSVIGVLAGKWVYYRSTTLEAPADVRVSWLIGLVAVSAIASLVAAAAPARAAGRTNLLLALRGQVSPRVVRRRMPAAGLAAVVIGTLCLFLATQRQSDGAAMGEGGQTLLAYIGVPLFFGGAVMSVPYVLMTTGRLARHLPLTPRIAVREVSRQRTRATASIGAVLATVAVSTGVSVFAASEDAYHAKTYAPSIPMNTAAYVGSSPQPFTSTKDEDAALARVRTVVPGAAGVWSVGTKDMTLAYANAACPAKGSADPVMGASVVGIDEAGMALLHLNDAQRAALTRGEFLRVGGSFNNSMGVSSSGFTDGPELTEKNGIVTLAKVVSKVAADGSSTVASCAPERFTTARLPFEQGFHLAGVTPNSLIATRATLARRHMPSHLTVITAAPKGGVDLSLEGRLRAAAPFELPLQVERGYSSKLTFVLAVMTAALAFVVFITTVVATLLNDAESQADAATLATVGAARGLRRRVVGAHAAAIGVIGALIGTAVGVTPGLILARADTNRVMDGNTGEMSGGTYAMPWWTLATMLVAVPLVAACVSMLFARRNPTLTRRER